MVIKGFCRIILWCCAAHFASVVEWSITTGCKPVGFGLRWFESNPAHNTNDQTEVPQFGRPTEGIPERVMGWNRVV